MKGVFLDSATIEPSGINFSRLTNVLPGLHFFDSTAPDELLKRTDGAEIIILNKVVLAKATLEKMPSVKCICVTATGVDNIDVAAANALGKAVYNVQGYATASSAQHVLALILAFASKVHLYHQQATTDKLWSQSPIFCLPVLHTQELYRKKLGIVGKGQSGQALAKIASALGMTVMFAERKNIPLSKTRPGYRPFLDVLQTADFVSLHCPLNDDTYHLIADRELKSMQPHAILLNVARGSIIDEEALLSALVSEQIGGAGLDVMSQEPPEPNHPLLDASIPNLIITPHIAWNTLESRQRLIDAVAQNIEAYKSGATTNKVSLQ